MEKDVFMFATNEVGTLKIIYDKDYQGVRDFDHISKMACWHSRYTLGDENTFRTPGDFREEINIKNAVILPLFLYDHSGLVMSTSSFNDEWDSGQVGYIYALKSDIREDYGVKRVTKKIIDKVLEGLQAEVEYYSDYLEGNIFGFKLEDTNGDEVESCWGFVGTDPNKNGIAENIPESYKGLLDTLHHPMGCVCNY